MKVLFDGCDFASRTGPNTFAKRLAFQLLANGHVIADIDDYDVVLTFIEPSFRQYKAPVVQRLDGIWFANQEEFNTKNVRIKLCYDSSDHVVFQSKFDHDMVNHWWGPSQSGGSSIVNNGVPIQPLKDVNKLDPALLKIRNDNSMVFCASANWHGQKRLAANVALFRHLKNNFYPNSCLIVMGANPYCYSSGNDIFYTGSVDSNVYDQVYAISDWMLHLAYLDHCPNTVIESLMQGTPVICSNSGGTKELVGDFGLILNERAEYKFELTEYDSPPEFDVQQVKTKLPELSTLGSHADIDIVNVARRYETIFENVIEQARR